MLDAKSLAANLFEGEVMGGLIPTLFADDPAAAELAIKAHASKAHWDINKLAKVFMVLEDISLKDAAGVLKKPRYKALNKRKYFNTYSNKLNIVNQQI